MSDMEFDSIDQIIAATIGEPGNRTFFIQAKKGEWVITLQAEKDQVMALARAAHQLLTQVSGRDEATEIIKSLEQGAGLNDTTPMQDDDPLWVAGSIELGFDPNKDMAFISLDEYVAEEIDHIPARARFWLSRAQLATFAANALKVVAQGRPICPLCGLPMDPEGHVCPASNGHQPGISI